MIGEINGVKIIATPKQYEKHKKSLEEQLEEKDKEIEHLKNILDRLGLLDKDIDKETKNVNMTVTLPKWLKDIGKKNKINFSKLLQESLYEILKIKGENKK